MKLAAAVLPIVVTLLLTPGLVWADAKACMLDWNKGEIRFASRLRYDNEGSKTNPTVDVSINGRPVKMILDTGSKKNIIWDSSLVGTAPASSDETIYAHVGSSRGLNIVAEIQDSQGRKLQANFIQIPESVLLEDGYAGVLSPQAIGGEGAFVIDFERDCFLVGSLLDVVDDTRFEVSAGRTIPNPFGFIAVPVGLAQREVPMLIDTGSADTIVSASLVSSMPTGRESVPLIDGFGNMIPQEKYTRVVDLRFSGRKFLSRSVIARPKTSKQEGIVDGDKEGMIHYGYLGMDILKDFVVYHDGKSQELVLLKRLEIGPTRSNPAAPHG